VVGFLLQLLYLWRKTPGFFTGTKARLYSVMMRKISNPLGNDIFGANVVAEPILCKGCSGGHEDGMAKSTIMTKKRSPDEANLQDQDSYVYVIICKHKF
jgi:hypothetical protein